MQQKRFTQVTFAAKYVNQDDKTVFRFLTAY
jgi:hypothetical protein